MKNLDEMPGHLIRRLQQVAVAVFHKEVGATGYDFTPVQFAALTCVDTNPGIDQITLASLIAYDRTTIAGVVDRLAHKGFISRDVSPKDRRARILKVTDAGRDALKRITPAVVDAQKIILGGLDDQEAEEFMRLMRKATVAVNDLSRAPLKSARSDDT